MANPLAYWDSSSVTKKKSFITLTPGELVAWNNLLGDRGAADDVPTFQNACPKNKNHLSYFFSALFD
jgi:hypothetical protein